MEISYGKGTSKFGTGVQIDLTGDEVASAIYAYLVAHDVHINGARTVRVNGQMIEDGEIYVDPSGFVIADGERWCGRGERTNSEGETLSQVITRLINQNEEFDPTEEAKPFGLSSVEILAVLELMRKM